LYDIKYPSDRPGSVAYYKQYIMTSTNNNKTDIIHFYCNDNVIYMTTVHSHRATVVSLMFSCEHLHFSRTFYSHSSLLYILNTATILWYFRFRPTKYL